MIVMRNIFITCALVLALAGSIEAQQEQSQQGTPPPAPSAPSPQPVIVEGNLKSVVRLYEYALNDAINRAGTNLVTWARGQLGPGITVNMASAAPPRVSAILLPDNSLAFDIALAEMNVQAFDLAMRIKPSQTQQAQQNLPDKANPKVTATGLVPADPVTPGAPAVNSTGGAVLASQVYSDYIREALLDAIVDQGHVLPIGPGQQLIVQVTPIDVAVTNVYDKNPSRKLNLSIKGDDLEAFRQKTLTRDQLRLRILDRRY
jgi:hypothetical protein